MNTGPRSPQALGTWLQAPTRCPLPRPRSDAYFQNTSISVPDLVAEFRPRPNGSRPTPSLGRAAADVSLAWDRPYSYGPNAGVQFWRNSASARQLLSLWWHLPGGRYHRIHDYEQHALQWFLSHLTHYGSASGRIETLALTPFPLGVDARGWPSFSHPVAHIDHGRNFYRLLLMSLALLRGDGRLPTLPAPRGHISSGAAEAVAAGRRLARQSKPTRGGGRRGRGLNRSAADDGRGARSEGESNHQTAQLRMRLLKLALRSMRQRDKRAAKQEAGAGAFVSGGGGPASGGKCRIHVEPFDASAAAVARMTPGRVPPAGTPGRSGFTGRDRAVPQRVGGGEESATALRLGEVLSGMPLHLVNCSADGAPSHIAWQRWRRVGDGFSIQPPSRSDFGPFAASSAALASPPGATPHCLHIGPARAPRQPDFPLAQLAPCEHNASARLAELQVFRYNASTGMLGLKPTVASLTSVAATKMDTASASVWTRHRSASLLAGQAASDSAARDSASGRRLASAAPPAVRGGEGRDIPKREVLVEGVGGIKHEAHVGDAPSPWAALPGRQLAPGLLRVLARMHLASAPPADATDDDAAARVPQREVTGWARPFLAWAGLVSETTEPARPRDVLAVLVDAPRPPAASGSTGPSASLRAASILPGAEAGVPSLGPGVSSLGAVVPSLTAASTWPGAAKAGAPSLGGVVPGGGPLLGRGKGGGKGKGRGGAWTPAQLDKFRRRRESRLKRRAPSLGQPCTSAYQKPHKLDDKSYEDCEDWCDDSKVNHCRYCKCRGCDFCHGDLSLPDWALHMGTADQCAAFGMCTNASSYPLCLSVWRGELEEGAPLVWSRCRKDVFVHQQWTLQSSPSAEAADAVQIQLGVGAKQKRLQSLCVAASVPSPRLLDPA